MDTDKDGQMNLAEMETWILAKVQQHFDEAKEENAHIFEHMDPDKDGNAIVLKYCHFVFRLYAGAFHNIISFFLIDAFIGL